MDDERAVAGGPRTRTPRTPSYTYYVGKPIALPYHDEVIEPSALRSGLSAEAMILFDAGRCGLTALKIVVERERWEEREPPRFSLRVIQRARVLRHRVVDLPGSQEKGDA